MNKSEQSNTTDSGLTSEQPSSIPTPKALANQSSTPKTGDVHTTINQPKQAAVSSSVQGTQIAVTQPLKLDISSSTDWPIVLVGLASILSSIVIARYTSRIQANQIKSNIANLRQRWIEDLRECASKFMESATYIHNKMSDHEDYLERPESTDSYSSMLSSQIKLSLMLDLKHDRNKAAIKISEEIIDSVKIRSFSDRQRAIGKHGPSFENLIRDILEDAWLDIQSDLMAHSWPGFTPCMRRKKSVEQQ